MKKQRLCPKDPFKKSNGPTVKDRTNLAIAIFKLSRNFSLKHGIEYVHQDVYPGNKHDMEFCKWAIEQGYIPYVLKQGDDKHMFRVDLSTIFEACLSQQIVSLFFMKDFDNTEKIKTKRSRLNKI